MTEERTGNRNSYDITYQMLRALSDGPKKVTHLMYQVGISYGQLKTYGTTLKKNGLIMEVNDHLTITEAGKKKLALLKEVCA